MKINHIGIAVKSIEEALKFYSERLGLESKEVVEVPEQKVKVIALQIGESRIELLESTSPDSPIAKFLEKRGEGIHHIAFEVTDIEKRLEELKEKGIRLIDEKPRQGAHGTRIAFIHPKSTQGVLIELVERY
ncbi:MAG TPA: methylmalonyl-CoA epimerase [bacterium]|nr:methylmalonyl-CoA epimerase [bacterium]